MQEQEQELLALAETRPPLDAMGRLETLITRQGDSPERRGLIGGRYKRLWRAAQKERLTSGENEASIDERRYLNKAIEQYMRGMDLDCNLCYCSSNARQLPRACGKRGDSEPPRTIDQLVLAVDIGSVAYSTTTAGPRDMSNLAMRGHFSGVPTHMKRVIRSVDLGNKQVVENVLTDRTAVGE